MDDERLKQLERRVVALESLVRGLLREEGPTPARLGSPAAPRVPLRERLATASSRMGTQDVDRDTLVRPGPGVVARETAEEWLGMKGVLGVGVLLMVMAAIFALVWAVDHGYLSPLVRCLGGTVVGLALVGLGWRQYHRDLRQYGAALMGTGCAVLYLVLWAAGQLYGLIPAVLGLNLIRVVCLSLAAIAYKYEEENLGVIAAAGAFGAPLLIPGVSPNAFFTMLYLGLVTLTLGSVAVKRRWRVMLNVVAIGFLLSAVFPSDPNASWVTLLWGACFGLGGFLVWRVTQFAEVRLMTFLGGWLLVGLAQAAGFSPYAVLLGVALLLTVPAWWEGLREGGVWLDAPRPGPSHAWSGGITVAFFLTPVFLLGAFEATPGEWLIRWLWLPAALLAVPYLVVGYQRVRSHFALVGVGLLLAAIHRSVAASSLVFPLMALALALAWSDHTLPRRDGRWFALIAAGFGLSALGNSLAIRATDALAFRDTWAVALWVAIGVTGLLAAAVWRVYPEESNPDPAHNGTPDLATPAGLRALAVQFAPTAVGVLWVVSGALTFGGVTLEIARLMGQLGLPDDTARLAAGLGVSAWWALFAGGLIVTGFQRSLTLVRLAGLGVACFAVAKVLLFDLAELSALYRVASFFILGVVLLGVAYLYHRKAREAVDAL